MSLFFCYLALLLLVIVMPVDTKLCVNQLLSSVFNTTACQLAASALACWHGRCVNNFTLNT